MVPRWSVVVVIVAIVGGFAWFRHRGDHAEPASPEPTSAATPGSAALRAPEGPSLGSASGSGTAIAGASDPGAGANPGAGAGSNTPRPELPGSATPPASTEFGAQQRDADWAPATETEIKKRFRNLRGAKLQDTECRQDQCLITVAGTEAEVGKTISELEGPRGLHGYAKNIILTAPEARDGKLVLRAYATFDR